MYFLRLPSILLLQFPRRFLYINIDSAHKQVCKLHAQNIMLAKFLWCFWEPLSHHTKSPDMQINATTFEFVGDSASFCLVESTSTSIPWGGLLTSHAGPIGQCDDISDGTGFHSHSAHGCVATPRTDRIRTTISTQSGRKVFPTLPIKFEFFLASIPPENWPMDVLQLNKYAILTHCDGLCFYCVCIVFCILNPSDEWMRSRIIVMRRFDGW